MTIAQAGGAAIACRPAGAIYTGAFQVPAVAWHLGEHLTTVESASAPGDAPPVAPPSSSVEDDAGSRIAVAEPREPRWRGAVRTFAISERAGGSSGRCQA